MGEEPRHSQIFRRNCAIFRPKKNPSIFIALNKKCILLGVPIFVQPYKALSYYKISPHKGTLCSLVFLDWDSLAWDHGILRSPGCMCMRPGFHPLRSLRHCPSAPPRAFTLLIVSRRRLCWFSIKKV